MLCHVKGFCHTNVQINSNRNILTPKNSHKSATEMGHSLDVLFDNTKMTNEMLTDIEKING